jgi:hypothetical protein
MRTIAILTSLILGLPAAWAGDKKLTLVESKTNRAAFAKIPRKISALESERFFQEIFTKKGSEITSRIVEVSPLLKAAYPIPRVTVSLHSMLVPDFRALQMLRGIETKWTGVVTGPQPSLVIELSQTDTLHFPTREEHEFVAMSEGNYKIPSEEPITNLEFANRFAPEKDLAEVVKQAAQLFPKDSALWTMRVGDWHSDSIATIFLDLTDLTPAEFDALLNLLINHFETHSVSASYWIPFFEPKVRADELLSRLAQKPGRSASVSVPLGKGGEAYAMRDPKEGIKVLAKKNYHNASVAKKVAQLLTEMANLANEGVFGELKVAKVYGVAWKTLSYQYIEGQKLKDLIEAKPNELRTRELFDRYQTILKTGHTNLMLKGYELEDFPADDISFCQEILEAQTGDKSSDRIYRAGSLMANRPKKQFFGIDADNIVVEWSTGDFYLVDPL